MKTTFYFIRHGEKDLTKKERPLTVLGKKQAEKTGLHLLAFPIEKVIFSPSLRTKQTAEIISNILYVPMIEEHNLHERIERTNREESLEDFSILWHKSSQNRHWSPSEGDSSYNAGKRIEKVLNHIKKEKIGHVAIVSHGGAISDFLRNVFSLELKFAKRWFYDIAIHECSITIVEHNYDTGKFTLKSVNDKKHLL